MPAHVRAASIPALSGPVRGGTFLCEFRTIPDLPKELYPPNITLTGDMFRIKPGDKLAPLPEGIAEK